jgi:hypothetical protein
MNDKKTFSIGILSLTAVVLFVANFMPLPTSNAAEAIKERDFTVVTARITSGGEGLYIADNRTAMMAVFTWDNAARTIALRDMRPVVDAFQ